jgi:hypothetical protein
MLKIRSSRAYGTGSADESVCKIYTSGDENHLCGASLRENHEIHHAHGIDYHHIGMGLVPQITACSMSLSVRVSRRMIQLHVVLIGMVPV